MENNLFQGSHLSLESLNLLLKELDISYVFINFSMSSYSTKYLYGTGFRQFSFSEIESFFSLSDVETFFAQIGPRIEDELYTFVNKTIMSTIQAPVIKFVVNQRAAKFISPHFTTEVECLYNVNTTQCAILLITQRELSRSYEKFLIYLNDDINGYDNAQRRL